MPQSSPPRHVVEASSSTHDAALPCGCDKVAVSRRHPTAKLGPALSRSLVSSLALEDDVEVSSMAAAKNAALDRVASRKFRTSPVLTESRTIPRVGRVSPSAPANDSARRDARRGDHNAAAEDDDA